MAKRKRRERQARDETILVYVSEELEEARGGAFREMRVDELAAGVQDFLEKMAQVLRATPAMLGAFSLEEFEVSAEVGAGGKLGFLGSGVEGSAKGGLTFKFKRK